MNNKKVWIIGEEKATQYLNENGYKILDKNCKIAGIEIDIVALLPRKIQKREIVQEFKKRKFDNNQQKKLFETAFKNEVKLLRDILVFVEVKSRTSKKFGEPFEAVGNEKMHHIERGVLAYSKKYNKKNLHCRIDVISVVDDQVEHIVCAEV